MKLPVTCENSGCEMYGLVFNEIEIERGVDSFFNAFGHGSEEDADYCPKCGELGILGEPVKEQQ